VSTNVDAVARQLPSRQEKKGWGPIVVKAGEQLMTIDNDATSKNDGNHDIVFFATVTVGA
jgi:hypothetical protein